VGSMKRKTSSEEVVDPHTRNRNGNVPKTESNVKIRKILAQYAELVRKQVRSGVDSSPELPQS
jgi:hypothetical protein